MSHKESSLAAEISDARIEASAANGVPTAWDVHGW